MSFRWVLSDIPYPILEFSLCGNPRLADSQTVALVGVEKEKAGTSTMRFRQEHSSTLGFASDPFD